MTSHADRLKPLMQPISVKGPTAKELEISTKLQKYMDEKYPRETAENLKERELILADLNAKFRDWVRQTCVSKGLPEEIAAQAGGKIYTSGSYKLGVHDPGADIDTICVAPKHVTRDDFFSTLKDILLKTSGVENLVSIESAAVPIITFDYNNVNIDLLFAVLPVNTIASDIDIDDDNVLQGVDVATEKSLNGPRVTNMIVKLVGKSFESFLKVLRVVRLWAKQRGLYSNKMGYLGGVNYCILVAFVAQLYPNACPATLLQKFFLVLGQWKWPSPIQLCAPFDAGLGLEVWNANLGKNKFHVMPIITPAYPSMNSSVSVSKQSLQVMVDELQRARKVVTEIVDKGGDDWQKLFAPSEFFIDHSHYLAIDIYAITEEEKQSWVGFVEARLRKLVLLTVFSVLLESLSLCFSFDDDNCHQVESLSFLPLKNIRLFPQKFPLTSAESEHGLCYFIGFDIDKTRIRGNTLNIDSSISFFRDNLYAGTERKEGMEVKMTPLTWKNLPERVFASLGGKETAKETRKEKKTKMEEELKRRMAEAAQVGAAQLAAAASSKTTEPGKTENGEQAEENENGQKLDMSVTPHSNGKVTGKESPPLAPAAAATEPAPSSLLDKGEPASAAPQTGSSAPASSPEGKDSAANARKLKQKLPPPPPELTAPLYASPPGMSSLSRPVKKLRIAFSKKS